MAYYYSAGEPYVYASTNQYEQYVDATNYNHHGLVLGAPYVEQVAPLTSYETTTLAPVVETIAAPPQQVVYQHAPYPLAYDTELPAETLAEIESRVQSVHAATSRAPTVKRETIPVQGPPGRLRHIVRRLPTPQPDVIERTTVIKPAKDVVNVTIEKPFTPAPIVSHKQIVEDPGLPQVNHQVVAVPPRTRVVSPLPVRVASPYATASVRAISPNGVIAASAASYQQFF